MVDRVVDLDRLLTLKAIAMNLLSLSATFGLLVRAFQDGHLCPARLRSDRRHRAEHAEHVPRPGDSTANVPTGLRSLGCLVVSPAGADVSAARGRRDGRRADHRALRCRHGVRGADGRPGGARPAGNGWILLGRAAWWAPDPLVDFMSDSVSRRPTRYRPPAPRQAGTRRRLNSVGPRSPTNGSGIGSAGRSRRTRRRGRHGPVRPHRPRPWLEGRARDAPGTGRPHEPTARPGANSNYQEASEPSVLRHTGLRHRWPRSAAARIASSSRVIPRPGAVGRSM